MSLRVRKRGKRRYSRKSRNRENENSSGLSRSERVERLMKEHKRIWLKNQVMTVFEYTSPTTNERNEHKEKTSELKNEMKMKGFLQTDPKKRKLAVRKSIEKRKAKLTPLKKKPKNRVLMNKSRVAKKKKKSTKSKKNDLSSLFSKFDEVHKKRGYVKVVEDVWVDSEEKEEEEEEGESEDMSDGEIDYF